MNFGMSTTPARKKYRKRLRQRGLARFEVLARDTDRGLIRSLARRLAEDGRGAEQIRASVQLAVAGEAPKKGGILAALRRSPLVGVEVDLIRPVRAGRRVDL
jgi:hypothetical protein